jgi:hypothetical protein
LWVIFALPDPDTAGQNECGSMRNADPQHLFNNQYINKNYLNCFHLDSSLTNLPSLVLKRKKGVWTSSWVLSVFLWHSAITGMSSYCTCSYRLVPSSSCTEQAQTRSSLPVLRIRIRIESGFNQVSGSGSVFGIRIRIQEGKNGPKK